MSVLEAMDVNRDDLVSDDDDVPPDVTHELHRLKALGSLSAS